MKIPKVIHLHGQRIEIIFDPQLAYKEDIAGQAAYRQNRIFLQPPDRTNTTTQDQIEHSFCHELVHYILSHMSQDKLRKDEPFVDLFANLLHQALSTAEYEEG